MASCESGEAKRRIFCSACFCYILIKYYNEVVSHSNDQYPYALCLLIYTASRAHSRSERTPVTYLYPHR